MLAHIIDAIITCKTAQPDCGIVLGMEEHEEALRASTRRYRRTEAAHKESREASAADVIAALKAGMEPTKVANLSPFTATHVRKLAREAGIPPAVKGKPSASKPS
jgi:hypothetical protein